MVTFRVRNRQSIAWIRDLVVVVCIGTGTGTHITYIMDTDRAPADDFIGCRCCWRYPLPVAVAISRMAPARAGARVATVRQADPGPMWWAPVAA